MTEQDAQQLRAEITDLAQTLSLKQVKLKAYDELVVKIGEVERKKGDALADLSYVRIKTRNYEHWASAGMARQLLAVMDVEIDRMRAELAALPVK